MPQHKLVFYDGRKAVRLSDLPEEAWTIVRGGSTDEVDKLFATVAWLYRGVQLRANAVGSMPFAVLSDRGGDEVYKFDGVTAETAPPDDLEWLDDLPELLQRVEAAVTLGGRAYWERRANLLGTRTMGFAWLLPWTVTPKYSDTDLSHFDRHLMERTIHLDIEDVVYFWPPDYGVELGPAAHYPGKAVLQNAGVLGSMDLFLKGYFDRGMVKATLLKYRDAVSRDEGERVKEWWRRVFTGVRNAWAAEVVRGDFETLTIGEGIRDLRDNALTDKERESISAGLGVPQSKLAANAANFATKQSDDIMFYEDTVVPECSWIYRVLNRQVFHPLGYHIVAQPETLRIMQEDENERAQALRNYVESGMPLETAVEVLGVTVPNGLPVVREAAEPEPGKELDIDMVGAGLVPGAGDVPYNSAQIGAALEIIEVFNKGSLPRENATFMIQTFFNMPAAVADGLVPAEPTPPAASPIPPQFVAADDDDDDEEDDDKPRTRRPDQRALPPALQVAYNEEAGRFLRWCKRRNWEVNVSDFDSDILDDDDKEALLASRKQVRPFVVADDEEPVDAVPLSVVDEGDVARAVRAFRTWAAEHDPDMAALLDAEVVTEEDPSLARGDDS